MPSDWQLKHCIITITYDQTASLSLHGYATSVSSLLSLFLS